MIFTRFKYLKMMRKLYSKLLFFPLPGYHFACRKRNNLYKTGINTYNFIIKIGNVQKVQLFFCFVLTYASLLYPHSTGGGGGGYCFFSVRPSVRPKIFFVALFSATIDGRNLIFGHKFFFAILWEAFLDPSDSYFLFADLVGFYTH